MSRSHILERIRINKPGPRPLPDIPDFAFPAEEVLTRFQESVVTGGGRWQTVRSEADIRQWLTAAFPEAERIASTLPELPSNVELKAIDDPRQLEMVDIAILPSALGVAENGAVWLTEADCGGRRVLPFITQHLVVVLSVSDIVPDMHEAYRRVRTNETGFGVFVAGPSKTADIEQSLVIGAQGARSLTVLLWDQS